MYTMGTSGLPDIYTLSPRASGVYIRQTTHTHGITISYMYHLTLLHYLLLILAIAIFLLHNHRSYQEFLYFIIAIAAVDCTQ